MNPYQSPQTPKSDPPPAKEVRPGQVWILLLLVALLLVGVLYWWGAIGPVQIAASFFICLGLRYMGNHWFLSWFFPCTVLPIIVLLSIFANGGDGYMWPLALIVVSLYGAIAGAIGVAFGSLMRKGEKS